MLVSGVFGIRYVIEGKAAAGVYTLGVGLVILFFFLRLRKTSQQRKIDDRPSAGARSKNPIAVTELQAYALFGFLAVVGVACFVLSLLRGGVLLGVVPLIGAGLSVYVIVRGTQRQRMRR
jgi:hypothetical protein